VERFARICYESLTRAPLDPDSYKAAETAFNLSRASFKLILADVSKSADLDEAKMLAKKAVQIFKELKGPGSYKMANAFQALISIKLIKNDLTDETKSLLEVHLSNAIRYQGVDGEMTGCANHHLVRFHCNASHKLSNAKIAKIKHLQFAESYYKEASRIALIKRGPNHPDTLGTASHLNR
jgi:hypothetical protein